MFDINAYVCLYERPDLWNNKRLTDQSWNTLSSNESFPNDDEKEITHLIVTLDLLTCHGEYSKISYANKLQIKFAI